MERVGSFINREEKLILKVNRSEDFENLKKKNVN